MTLIDEFYNWAMMEGHGVYVWSVYVISAVALVVIGVWPIRAERRLRARVTSRIDEDTGA